MAIFVRQAQGGVSDAAFVWSRFCDRGEAEHQHRAEECHRQVLHASSEDLPVVVDGKIYGRLSPFMI
jgi:hypothetical protein